MRFGFVLGALLSLTEATMWSPVIYDHLYIALQACNGAISEHGMVCATTGNHMVSNDYCRCGQMPGFGSFADCLVRGYNETSLIEDFIEYCDVNTGIKMTNETFWANYSRALDVIEDFSTLADMDMDMSGVLNHPITINYTDFHIYQEYYQKRRNNNNVSIYYGYGMLGYWGAVLGLATMLNMAKKLFPSLRTRFKGRYSALIRKYITLRATYKRAKTKDIDLGLMLLPSRFETVVLFGFYLLSAVCNGVGIVTVVGNKIVPSVPADLCLKTAVRTGITVVPIFPLIIVFAGRNNLLQWMTGWNFSTFVTYHKWIGICVTILVLIHSITFSLYYGILHTYLANIRPKHVIWGMVGTVFGMFLMFQSMLVFRRRSYELFLLLHHLFAFMYMIGAYKHIDLYGYGVFYVVALGLWAVEKIFRLTRMSRFGIKKATVQLMPDETLRISVPKPKHWISTPGCYAFIYFLRPTCFWQSHPLSVIEDGNTLYMLAKIKRGMTHGLYKYVSNCQDKTAEINVALEGPYGHQSSARFYHNKLFLCGGNGAPGIYAECLDLAKTTSRNKFIWIVREWNSLLWFQDELKKLNDAGVNIQIYITRPYVDDESCDEQDEKQDSLREGTFAQIETLKQVEIKIGRPNIDAMIEMEIDETDGSLAIVTCGNPAMVDDVREAVCLNLHKTNHRIEFFEQLQVWT